MPDHILLPSLPAEHVPGPLARLPGPQGGSALAAYLWRQVRNLATQLTSREPYAHPAPPSTSGRRMLAWPDAAPVLSCLEPLEITPFGAHLCRDELKPRCVELADAFENAVVITHPRGEDTFVPAIEALPVVRWVHLGQGLGFWGRHLAPCPHPIAPVSVSASWSSHPHRHALPAQAT